MLLTLRDCVAWHASCPMPAVLLGTRELLYGCTLLCGWHHVRFYLQKTSTSGAHPTGAAMNTDLMQSQLVWGGKLRFTQLAAIL